MSYLCLNPKCNELVYSKCSHHDIEENKKVTILTCGHFYHTCCLNKEPVCLICPGVKDGESPTVLKRFNITDKTNKINFQRHYYRLMREKTGVDLPLQCLICVTDLEKSCPVHKGEKDGPMDGDSSRLIFLDCGHVFHICCLSVSSSKDHCFICMKSPISQLKTVKLKAESTRDQLIGFYQRLYRLSSVEMATILDISLEDQKARYFKTEMEEMPGKYCRCILHVARQQPDWCLQEQAWFQERDGKKCYNPYAICTKSVSRKGLVECFLNYNLDGVPDIEIKALVLLKRKLLDQHKLPHTLSGLRQLQQLLEKK